MCLALDAMAIAKGCRPAVRRANYEFIVATTAG